MLKFKLPEEKFNTESTILTLVVCAAVVLIMLTSTIYPPDPPLEEELPEVMLDEAPPISLGMPDEGADRPYEGPSGGGQQASDQQTNTQAPGEDVLKSDDGTQTNIQHGQDGSKTNVPIVKPARPMGSIDGLFQNSGGDNLNPGSTGHPKGDPKGTPKGILGGTGPFKNTLGRNPTGRVDPCAFDHESSVVVKVRVNAEGRVIKILGIDRTHELNLANSAVYEECAKKTAEKLDFGPGEAGDGIVVIPFKKKG